MKIINLGLSVFFLLIFLVFQVYSDEKNKIISKNAWEQLMASKREAFEMRNDIELERLYRDDAIIKRKAHEDISEFNRDDYLKYMFHGWNDGIRDYSIEFKVLGCKKQDGYVTCQSLIREYIKFTEGHFIYSCSKYTDKIQNMGGVVQIFDTFVDNDVNDCQQHFPATPLDKFDLRDLFHDPH